MKMGLNYEKLVYYIKKNKYRKNRKIKTNIKLVENFTFKLLRSHPKY